MDIFTPELESLELRENDLFQFLDKIDAINYGKAAYDYVLKCQFLEQSMRELFKPTTLEEILHLYKLRSEKQPPLKFSMEEVHEMLNELKSVKIKKLKIDKKNPIYNFMINGRKYAILSWDEINNLFYGNVDLYEEGYIDAGTVEWGIERLIKGAINRNKKENIEWFISSIIKNKIETQFKTDKKQRLLFPKKEKEDSESRINYRLNEEVKQLYSENASQLMENICMYMEGQEKPSMNLLKELGNALHENDIYLDEDLNNEEALARHFNLSYLMSIDDGIIYS